MLTPEGAESGEVTHIYVTHTYQIIRRDLKVGVLNLSPISSG